MKKIFQENWLMKQDSVNILIFNKIDFQPKLIKRERKDTLYSSKEKSTKITSQFWTSMLQIMFTLLFQFLVLLVNFVFLMRKTIPHQLDFKGVFILGGKTYKTQTIRCGALPDQQEWTPRKREFLPYHVFIRSTRLRKIGGREERGTRESLERERWEKMRERRDKRKISQRGSRAQRQLLF